MNHLLTVDERNFRDDVREFLSTDLPPHIRLGGRRASGVFADAPLGLEWIRILAKRGWSVPRWPAEWGGCNWTHRQHDIFASELAAADAPPLSPLGIGMAAPVLFAFGTEQQKQRWLPDIRAGKSYWCQGYSEPGSGSDLASLRCRAHRDGDAWVINGTKIWTSHAQWASHMFCLVRTDSSGKPQQGISFLMFSMSHAGITVRPIISMSGDHELNQVFFDNVRVPLDALVGEENQGWTVAKYLLEHERGGSMSPMLQARLVRLRQASRDAFSFAPPATDEQLDRDIALANAQVRVDTLHAWEQRVLAARMGSGTLPSWLPAAPSMGKLLGTELKQHLTELGLDIAGPYGATALRIEEAQTHPLPIPEASVFATHAYLNDRAASIYGGTNEVQRNLIARHLLGADIVEPAFAMDASQGLMWSSLQSWLQDQMPLEHRTQCFATPAAIEPLWHGLAVELGLVGAALPERVGGTGGGLADLLLICQALGTALVAEPFVTSAVLGASLIQALPDPGADPLLQGLIQGDVRLAVATLESDARSPLDPAAATLHSLGGSVLLSGGNGLVRCAPWATHWLVPARGLDGQVRIAVVDPRASGIQRRDFPLIDGAWASRLVFDEVSVQAVLGDADARAALDLALDITTLAAGAEAVGVMQRLMRDTIDYMHQRMQFGQPLANFQALQHRLADMYMALVQAGAAVGACSDIVDMDEPPARRASRVSSAHVTVLRAARLVGQGAVQLHGGMGVTDELAIGHGFKRLTVLERQFGGLTHHLRRAVTEA
jgi:acyl-CoA dehydrogenase